MTGAGARDQIITLQALSRTPDGIGGTTEAWAALNRTPRVWAAVNVKRSAETMEDGRMSARQTATFEILNRDDLNETQRLIWNGEAWNIRSVQRSSGRRATIIIEAERGTI